MKHWRGLIVLGTLTGIVGGMIRFAMGGIPKGGTIVAAPEATKPSVLQSGDELTVISWNVHYGGGPTLDVGRGQSRAEVVGYLDEIAAFIRRSNADVVALQEVDRSAIRSYDIDQLAWLQEATDLKHAVWTPTWDAGWVPHPGLNPSNQIGRVQSGQVILSRFPLQNDSHIRLPQPPQDVPLYNRFYLHRHLTDVDVVLNPSLTLRVINAHLEAFHSENRQAHAAVAINTVGQNTYRTLLMGDMNCTPPEAQLRKAFPDEPETDMSKDDTINALRSISGMQEIVPKPVYSANEAAWFTFPASNPNRRLDYIFHGDGLKLVHAEVPQDTPPASDHLPVIARFKLD